MGTTKAIKMEDPTPTEFEGDGKSTVDIYDAPEQLGPPDGKPSFEIGDYAGADRVTESIQNNVADLSVSMTSEPSGQGNDDTKSFGTAPSAPVPTTSAENLNPAQQETPENADTEAPKKRVGRPKADASTDTTAAKTTDSRSASKDTK